jgi:hypothetical protein
VYAANVVKVFGQNQSAAATTSLASAKRTVGNGFALAIHELAGAFERLATVLNVAFLGQLLEPGHPLLHHLLCPLLGRPASLTAAVQKYNSFILFLLDDLKLPSVKRLEPVAADIFLRLKVRSYSASGLLTAFGCLCF